RPYFSQKAAGKLSDRSISFILFVTQRLLPVIEIQSKQRQLVMPQHPNQSIQVLPVSQLLAPVKSLDVMSIGKTRGQGVHPVNDEVVGAILRFNHRLIGQ